MTTFSIRLRKSPLLKGRMLLSMISHRGRQTCRFLERLGLGLLFLLLLALEDWQQQDREQ